MDDKARRKARQDPMRSQMTKELAAADGRRRYDRRKVSVEPVFGQLKAVQKFREVLLRGQDKAGSMWRFTCTVHNLRKIMQATA